MFYILIILTLLLFKKNIETFSNITRTCNTRTMYKRIRLLEEKLDELEYDVYKYKRKSKIRNR